MSNSFYYFFSSTPQVLAGILALFGVFVIFKIQTIKSELLSIGNIISKRDEHLFNTSFARKNDGTLQTKQSVLMDLNRYVIW